MNIPDTVQPTLLLILDGFGLAPAGKFNAIANADAPTLNGLIQPGVCAALETCGEAVGLPKGVMGNSEVGHMSIGSGRVVWQALSRINREIASGEFFKNESLQKAIEETRDRGARIHFMGLLSDAGVHSHQSHLDALLKMCADAGLENVSVHAFLDGRDTAPQLAMQYLESLQDSFERLGVGQLATMSGRYFAMDRDNRWDRTKIAYDMLWGQGKSNPDFRAALQESYDNKRNDEFVEPVVIDSELCLQEGDSVLFFNFRADRVRQMSVALGFDQFSSFDRIGSVVPVTTLTEYKDDFPFPVAYPSSPLHHLLGDVISDAGLQQLRAAETEKYAHVTFFFNGGSEAPRDGEDRIMVPSPKDVATYDQKPEMSAPELSEKLIKQILTKKHSFIVANFANADMVGHTGNYEASLQAVQVLDNCVSKLIAAAHSSDYHVFLTADHGNIEEMMDEAGNHHTQHTLNPVPFVSLPPVLSKQEMKNGSLADIMPTILETMKLSVPKDVTGKNLINVSAKS